jgi:glutamate/aspartate transport system substrate-binding protein
MMMRKFYPAAFAVMAVVSIGDAAAAGPTGTLRKIQETGAITLGFRDSSVPFSYLDGN